jgi:hypothetical protein
MSFKTNDRVEWVEQTDINEVGHRGKVMALLNYGSIGKAVKIKWDDLEEPVTYDEDEFDCLKVVS